MGVVVLVGDIIAIAIGMVVGNLHAVVLAYGFLALAGQWFTGAYGFRLNLSGLRDAPRVVSGLAVPMLAVAPLAVMTTSTDVLLRAGAVSGLAIILSRVVGSAIVAVLRRRGRMTEGAVILGSGIVAAELAQRFAEHPELGLRVIGHLDDGEDPVQSPAKRLGDAADVDRVVRGSGAQHVVAAFCHAHEGALVELLRLTREADVDVHVVPRFFELGLGTANHCSEEVWGIPLHRLPPPAHRAVGRHLKRGFDIVVSSLAIILASPVLVAIAIGVHLSSPGPTLFRQLRIGQHGNEFEVLKFRSMPVNSDSDTTWTVAGDDRLTRFGRFIRDKSLDELPQLFNVLRGDMSLVGPRPERPTFADTFNREVDSYGQRHRVPVGITGWAQIHGLRGDTSIADRARFDNNYIENWSLWSDLLILARTVGVVVRGQGTT